MSQIPFDNENPFSNLPDFIENPESRCPCVLLLDTSGSMAGRPIDELNQGLQTFAQDVKNDVLASRRVECAIITFGTSVNLACDFITADQFSPPSLSADGATPMGEAVNMAIDLIKARKQIYKQNGVAYYRPWVLLLSDGAPTDASVWPNAAARAKREQQDKSLILFAIGVSGANLATLEQFSLRPAHRLEGLKFSEFFRWLSSSLSARSRSQPGESIALEDPTKSWAVLEG